MSNEEIKQCDIKPDELNLDDIAKMAPKLAKHPKLVNKLLHWLRIDGVNKLHRDNCHTPGVEFTDGLLRDLDIKVEVEGRDVLDNLPEGAFITVSNHPFGALDGIILINLIGHKRPQFKVIVNMILNHITAMRPNFIAVDQSASDDPEKRKVSMLGLKTAMMQVKKGEPIGMFPAGAMSKGLWKRQLNDREWQSSMIRLIKQLKVPVIPIFFQGHNSFMFDFLGVACWQLRTARLPSEVFRKMHTTIKVSIGQPITPDEQAQHSESLNELGDFIRERTYALRATR